MQTKILQKLVGFNSIFSYFMIRDTLIFYKHILAISDVVISISTVKFRTMLRIMLTLYCSTKKLFEFARTDIRSKT